MRTFIQFKLIEIKFQSSYYKFQEPISSLKRKYLSLFDHQLNVFCSVINMMTFTAAHSLLPRLVYEIPMSDEEMQLYRVRDLRVCNSVMKIHKVTH